MATETTVQLSDSGHLPCGNVPFHKGVCRDAYLKRRTCEHCEHLVTPDEPAPEPDVDGPAEPAKSASKAAWVDFAVAQGADRDAAEAKTRDGLVDEFGTTD
ncbi:MAG: hypothetical protein KDB37_21315 [Ilumatobacter sp.]|nr:hypothetical protein [Ilumatobacter sp.]